MTTVLRELELTGLPLFRRGKVRDTYDLDDRLLMVASDRLSAFDVVLPDGIPDKGRVLTLLSVYWFDQTREIVPNHLISAHVDDLPEAVQSYREILRDRFMIVRKAERIEIECVVRGYLSGSAWVEYQASGTVAGKRLPAGLVESQRLPEPIFTPATKNDDVHDENISIDEMRRMVGTALTDELMETSLRLYDYVAAQVSERGLILADTKFEFGMIDGQLTVIDELCTPDSSRYWDEIRYEPGRPQESFDKQYVRDWLIESGWNRNPPAPPLPADVVNGTAERYREAFRRITGRELPEA